MTLCEIRTEHILWGLAVLAVLWAAKNFTQLFFMYCLDPELFAEMVDEIKVRFQKFRRRRFVARRRKNNRVD